MNEPTNKQLLITGASGFIGSAFCNYPGISGYALRVLLRAPLESFELNLDTYQDLTQELAQKLKNAQTVEPVAGSLLDIQSLRDACRNVDTVVHLASVAHVSPARSDSTEQVIVEGTRNLLTAAIENKVRRFVYVSSSLAQVVADNGVDITAYGWYKYSAEVLLLEAQKRGEIEVVIVRPVNVYGPGMKGNIASMISLVMRQRLPPLPVLDARLSLVGAEDVCQALQLAIECRQAAGRTYTVTDGQAYRISDIEAAIYRSLGKRFPRWRTPRVVLFAASLIAGMVALVRGRGTGIGLRTYRNVTTDNLFDNTAICQELGFTPRTTFYQELPSIIAKISQQNN